MKNDGRVGGFTCGNRRRRGRALTVYAIGLVVAGSFVNSAAARQAYGDEPSKPRKKQQEPPSTLKEEGERLFSQRGKAGDPGKEGAASAWSIVIVAFELAKAEDQPGSDERTAQERRDFTERALAERADLARQSREKTRTVAGLPDAFLEQRGEKLVLAYGRYTGPNAPDAQADLERIRSLEINGGRPFQSAMLAPPENAGVGSIPEFDLRNCKKIYGADALYTLQVGVYARTDRKPPTQGDLQDFRRLAEEAVVRLRREGEEAFYYHGPNMSMVTVGVFDADAIEQDPLGAPAIASPAVQALRQKHPYNLVNGGAYKVRVRGVPENDPAAWRVQASLLVEIPKE
jgi:hypothetical protein